MSKQIKLTKRRLAVATGTIVTMLAATAGIASLATGNGSAAPGADARRFRAKVTHGVRVEATRVQSGVPQQMFDQPFVDGRQATRLGDAERELSFRPVAPAALGGLAKIYLHSDYRPQALALVFDHPTYGRVALTEEPIQMSEALQRQSLETMAAQCDPATGCVGSWTMHGLYNGNRALVISNPPDVNAVVWIHTGGIRYQLMGPGTSLSPSAAIAAANLVEAAASSS